MIMVVDHSAEGYMEVNIDEPDYKDHFCISSEIYKVSYIMDGGDNLRSVCLGRQDWFKDHPQEKMERDSLWVRGIRENN